MECLDFLFVPLNFGCWGYGGLPPQDTVLPTFLAVVGQHGILLLNPAPSDDQPTESPNPAPVVNLAVLLKQEKEADNDKSKPASK
jgi:hypothetical protein